MWLLNTARATLTYFPGPEDVPGGYAILSHVWRENEQSFKDLQALREACALTGQNPRDRASDKIRVFCELAETHGYQWVWVDTCCIDKSSSSELSEAINSMYRYYTLAEVCYAYLFDVPTGDVKDRCSRAWTFFKESKWHTRGWTLQELLAPNTVLLLSRDWATLGTKATLSQDLWLATKIPEDVLQRRRSIGEYSIAQRMSWAARRQTTRLEDEAYCLMGIFDINMPTLYGEGRKAFHRLQGEIMKKSIDTSLFAWGITDTTNTRFALDAPTSSLQCKRHHFRFAHAFAQSPYDFLDCTDVCFVSPPELRSRVSYLRGNVVIERLPAFTDTPHGVLASIIVFDVDGTLYALLSCERRSVGLPQYEGQICLQLYRCCHTTDPTRPTYHPIRRVVQGAFLCGARNATWQDLFLSYSSVNPPDPQLELPPLVLFPPFQIFPRRLAVALKRHGVGMVQVQGEGEAIVLTMEGGSIYGKTVIVRLGICGALPSRPPWAFVDSGGSYRHDCSQHHIHDWHMGTRVFRLVLPVPWMKFGIVKNVQLSFSCSHIPSATASSTLHVDFLPPRPSDTGLSYPHNDSGADADAIIALEDRQDQSDDHGELSSAGHQASDEEAHSEGDNLFENETSVIGLSDDRWSSEDGDWQDAEPSASPSLLVFLPPSQSRRRSRSSRRRPRHSLIFSSITHGSRFAADVRQTVMGDDYPRRPPKRIRIANYGDPM